MANSEKKHKKLSNKKFRMKEKQVINKCNCIKICSCIYPKINEISDIWTMSKDGKHYIYLDDRYYNKLKRK